MRLKLEGERRALSAFVSRFDSLGFASAPAIPSRLRKPTLPFGPKSHTSQCRSNLDLTSISEKMPPRSGRSSQQTADNGQEPDLARIALDGPSLLNSNESEFSELVELDPFNDTSFERGLTVDDSEGVIGSTALLGSDGTAIRGSLRVAFQDKENLVP